MGLFNRLQDELEAREQSPGLRMSDILAIGEPQCGLLNWLIRRAQVGPAEVAAFLQQEEAAARGIMADLRDKGYVREIEVRGVTTYRVRLAPKRGRRMPADLWHALDDKVEPDAEA